MDSLTLVHLLWAVCWQAGLLAGIVWMLTRLLPRAPARWRHALWLLVLVKFCIPPMLTLPVPSQHQQIATAMPVHSVQARMPAGTDTTISHRSTTFAMDDQRQPRDGDRQVAAIPQERPPIFDRLQLPASFSDYAPDLLVLAWICGMLVMGGRLLVRGRRQAYILRHADEATEEQHALLDEATRSLGLRHHPRLLLSPLASTPMLVGVLRPAILLPPEILQQCRPSEVRAMLAHELAHVKREDLCWFWLQQWVQVLFFFHPAIWLAARELHQARELACDELVLARTTIPAKEYAAGYVSALKLAQQRPSFAPGVAMAEPFEVEQRRIRQMLRHATTPFTLRWLLALLLLAAVGLPTFLGCGIKLPPRPHGVGLAVSPWPRYGGNARNTSCGTGTPAKGKIIWQTQVVNDMIMASPIIGPDGTVYVMSATKGRLFALNGNTGRVKWSTSTSASPLIRRWRKIPYGRVESTPVIGANGLIYIGSPEQYIYAFDARNGKRVWRANANDPTEAGFHASPTISPDGKLYYSTSDVLLAMGSEDGNLTWKFSAMIHDPNRGTYGTQVNSTPVFGPDGTVYVTAGDLFALDPGNGGIKWQYHPTNSQIKSSCWFSVDPVLGSNGLIYLGRRDEPIDEQRVASASLVAYDPVLGKERWTYLFKPITIPFTSPSGKPIKPYNLNHLEQCPAIGPDGTVYAITNAGEIHAIDGVSGRRKWMRAVHRLSQPSCVIGGDGTVYVNTNGIPVNATHASLSGLSKSQLHQMLENKLVAMDGQTGKTKWELHFGTVGYVFHPAIGADGTLYYGTHDGKVIAVH